MLTKKDRQGLWLLAGVSAVLLAMFGVKLSLDSNKKPGPDNCVGNPLGNTVLVLDYSDQIPEQTREEIVARGIAYVRDHVKVNERVSVFTISALSKKQLKPVIAVCRPPEGGNRVIENPEQMHKRFLTNFEKPLRDVLAVAPGNSDESPIAQALTDISLSQYLRGQTNNLVVFSDMLENTKGFSLYRCSAPDTVLARYRDSVKGATERPEFRNTTVTLNVIPRLNQTREMLKCRDVFWTWFFGNNKGEHAQLVVDYLPGGTPMGGSTSGGVK